MKTKTIKTLLMILWLMPAIAIHADGIVKASSPTTATTNSNLYETAISSKAKTPRLLNATLENQLYQLTCSHDNLNCSSASQIHYLVFKVGVELRPWVFAFTRKIIPVRVTAAGVRLAASSLVSRLMTDTVSALTKSAFLVKDVFPVFFYHKQERIMN